MIPVRQKFGIVSRTVSILMDRAIRDEIIKDSC
jgi:hypothetical protein